MVNSCDRIMIGRKFPCVASQEIRRYQCSTHLWPTVAFQIDQQLLGDADDVEASAETIDIDPIVVNFHFISSLPKCFQLQSRSSLTVARDSLKKRG